MAEIPALAASPERARGAAGGAATIRDVARAADVSVATVSRVLNGKGPVAAETSLRVREWAERLNYHPHAAARSLITRRTHSLGVILPDLHGEFFSELIRGIDLAARCRGFHLLVSSSHSDASEVLSMVKAVRGRVDGLVIMLPTAPTSRLDFHLPTVLLNSPAAGGAAGMLRVDNRGGARAMVRHLASLGHQRIAFVAGPRANFDAAERLLGYRQELAALGLEASADLEFAGDFTEAGGHRAARCWLALADRPSALFAANDATAIGVLGALAAEGVRVPRDVALGGFDDIPLARLVTPALTTVRVPIAELGARAVERLVAAIDGDDEPAPAHQVVASELVVRESTRAPDRIDKEDGPWQRG